jgi:alcohol dehydrogenase class IV
LDKKILSDSYLIFDYILDINLPKTRSCPKSILKPNCTEKFMKENYWTFLSPTKIIFGLDTLEKLSDIVEEFGSKKIFLVTGRRSMEKLGITERVKKILKGKEIVVFNEVEPNPSSVTVDKGIELCRKTKSDLVIGLGGGSAMDAAKVIAILVNNEGPTTDYLNKMRKIKNKGLRMIAIPTTSGTGSEVNNIAVITDERKKDKAGLKHEYMYPDFALVDPKLTKSMSRELTAGTGLDSLSHALETYWSRNSNPLTDLFSLKTIELVYKNLVKACDEPNNLEFRKRMSLAAMFAGLSLTIGTNLMHAIARPLTVLYGIPHGHACGLSIVECMRFNSKATKKMRDIAKITGAKTVEEGIDNFERMIKQTGLPMRLSELGIKEKDIDIIVKRSMIKRKLEKNPREIKEKDIREIIMKIF